MKKLLVFFILLSTSITVWSDLYQVNSGDLIHVEVYGEPELALDINVDSQGFVEYPFIGKLKVQGQSIEAIKDDFVAKLKDGYFVDPQVTVYIKKFKPFFIQGEVNSPGSYPFEMGLTVQKAITLAGGLTERASKKKIYLTKPDKSEPLRVQMDQLVSAGDIIEIKESFF
jgi:polysaccharide export outer membrane protein